MRFLNFVLKAGEPVRLGMFLGDGIVDVTAAMRKLPLPFDSRRGKGDMLSLIKMWSKAPADALQPMQDILKQPPAMFKDITYTGKGHEYEQRINLKKGTGNSLYRLVKQMDELPVETW